MPCVRYLQQRTDQTENATEGLPPLPEQGPGPTQGNHQPNLERLRRIYSLGELGYTHSEQHVHICSANQESSRKKLYLLKLSEARQAAYSPD